MQLFQNNVITQSRLFSYIDVYFGSATLGVVALISIAVTEQDRSSAPFIFIRGRPVQGTFRDWLAGGARFPIVLMGA